MHQSQNSSATKTIKDKPTSTPSTNTPSKAALYKDNDILLSTPEHKLPSIQMINQPGTSQSTFSTYSDPLSDQSTEHYKWSRHWDDTQTVIIQIQDTEFKLTAARLKKASRWFRDAFNNKNSDTEILDLDETGVFAQDFEILLNSQERFMQVLCITCIFKEGN